MEVQEQTNQQEQTIQTEEKEIPFKVPKKRGRPKKEQKEQPVNKPQPQQEPITNIPKKKPRRKKAEITEESIKMNIMGMHMLLAIRIPEAMISEENARAEAKAIKDIVDRYGLAWIEKYLPMLNFAGTIIVCEYPTALAIANAIRGRNKPKGEDKNEEHKVTPFNIR